MDGMELVRKCPSSLALPLLGAQLFGFMTGLPSFPQWCHIRSTFSSLSRRGFYVGRINFLSTLFSAGFSVEGRAMLCDFVKQ